MDTPRPEARSGKTLPAEPFKNISDGEEHPEDDRDCKAVLQPLKYADLADERLLDVLGTWAMLEKKPEDMMKKFHDAFALWGESVSPDRFLATCAMPFELVDSLSRSICRAVNSYSSLANSRWCTKAMPCWGFARPLDRGQRA